MAAKKILVPYDFNKNEIQNAVLQVLATAPSPSLPGQVYYDSTIGRPMFRTAATFIDLSARANHSGTQTFSTITSLPTTLAGYGIVDAAPLTHVGVGGTAHANVVAAGAAGFMTGADKTKLDGIATGATANSTDAFLLARANHTGTQLASTVSDFDTQVRLSRLDQLAIPTASVNLNSQKIIGLATPTASTDAANKQYVDDQVAGLSWKNEVRLATTAAGTLASSFANGSTVDGTLLVTGDRILIKDQVAQAENGLYTVNVSGAPTRATDADTGAEFTGAAVFVTNGTTNSGQRFVCNTPGTITLGTTAVTFVAFGGGSSYTAGNGLVLSANDFNVGAGLGILVTADTVTIDTAVVSRKVTGLIGNGAATSISVTHSLANQWVVAQVFEVATLAMIDVDTVLTDANTTTFIFAVAPATNAYRVVIQG